MKSTTFASLACILSRPLKNVISAIGDLMSRDAVVFMASFCVLCS
jgi:hypothetical protein